MKCICKFCTHDSPLFQGLLDALPEEKKKDMTYLINRLMTAEEDRDVLDAMTHGQWPGWEWIIEAKKERDLK